MEKDDGVKLQLVIQNKRIKTFVVVHQPEEWNCARIPGFLIRKSICIMTFRPKRSIA